MHRQCALSAWSDEREPVTLISNMVTDSFSGVDARRKSRSSHKHWKILRSVHKIAKNRLLKQIINNMTSLSNRMKNSLFITMSY